MQIEEWRIMESGELETDEKKGWNCESSGNELKFKTPDTNILFAPCAKLQNQLFRIVSVSPGLT